MRYVCLVMGLALSGLSPAWMFGQQPSAPVLALPNAVIGMNLEASAMVTLNGPVPAAGIDVTLTSQDPSRLVLSTKPDTAGAPSIVVKMSLNIRELEVYLQALDKSGTVTYTASAPGLSSATGTVTLTPSGIIIGGPFGAGKDTFMTTTGAPKTKINVYSAQLDPALKYVARQRLAGGRSVEVSIANSKASIGKVDTSTVKIAGGSNNTTLLFQPAAEGETKLTVSVPSGFSAPAEALYTTVTAKVSLPGMVITEDIMIGQNLQDGGTVGLNEPAPAGGLEVTLTCQNPGLLLFSPSATQKGSNSLKIKIPEGGIQASYYMQALTGSGRVTYMATASGYHNSRPATVTLAPSGVVVTGPLSFTRAGGSPGFVARLSTHKPTVITVYTVFLDPVTHRSADVTVQPLRAGVSLTLPLSSSDPTVGTIGSQVTITSPSNQASTEFAPLKVGETILSVVTPEGYTASSNATTLKAIVTE